VAGGVIEKRRVWVWEDDCVKQRGGDKGVKRAMGEWKGKVG